MTLFNSIISNIVQTITDAQKVKRLVELDQLSAELVQVGKLANLGEFDAAAIALHRHFNTLKPKEGRLVSHALIHDIAQFWKKLLICSVLKSVFGRDITCCSSNFSVEKWDVCFLSDSMIFLNSAHCNDTINHRVVLQRFTEHKIMGVSVHHGSCAVIKD